MEAKLSRPGQGATAKRTQVTFVWGLEKARESGTPGDEDTVKCIKAGPCRRPHGVQLGSPTTWEAHCKDRRTHGSRFPLEAIVCIYVKPDTAGGPVMKKLQDTWKPVFCRRPDCAHLGSPRNRIPCDTLTLLYLESGTWSEALWTGRPRHEYPTVGMQMTQ